MAKFYPLSQYEFKKIKNVDLVNLFLLYVDASLSYHIISSLFPIAQLQVGVPH